jgi:Fic family protein
LLIKENKIKQTVRGRYSIVKDAKSYIEKPFYERKKVVYNKDFLRFYIPNETFFLSKQDQDRISNSIADMSISTQHLRAQKRNIENLLIDLSFSSSHLEGNTYSYLDTEVLINYNEIAENKLVEETQMILNHKKAIEYLIYYKDTLPYTKKTFFEIHQLLGEKLLQREDL